MSPHNLDESLTDDRSVSLAKNDAKGKADQDDDNETNNTHMNQSTFHSPLG